jgi:hypothetical protein
MMTFRDAHLSVLRQIADEMLLRNAINGLAGDPAGGFTHGDILRARPKPSHDAS